MRPEVLSWWKQALEDLDSAEVNLKQRKYYLTVFLCQQSVEKGLKALLLNTKRTPDIISHSLVFLGKESGIPSKFDAFIKLLSRQYTLTRYPDMATKETPYELYDEKIAKDFLLQAKEVIEWIRKRLK